MHIIEYYYEVRFVYFPSYEVIFQLLLFNFRALSLSIYMISPLFAHVYILYYIRVYKYITIYIIYIYQSYIFMYKAYNSYKGVTVHNPYLSPAATPH